MLSGQQLTLINPAYMTRQVHELGYTTEDTILLNFTRFKSADRARVDLSSLIEAVMEKHPAPEHVTSNVDVPETLPAIFVDMLQIKQVLVNLITNNDWRNQTRRS